MATSPQVSTRSSAAPLLALLALFLAPPLAAQAAPALEPVDRIVAVVDEDPVFFSDLERALAFGFARPGKDPSNLRPVLDQVVDERLRAHDIDRYGVPPASPTEIDAQLNRVETAHGGPAALEAELARLGSSREELRRKIDLQLRILAYIDERLAPRVFVDDAELNVYYEGELLPEMTRQGLARPPLAEVREPIRAVLRERKLNQEAAEWTQGLRETARLTDLLDGGAAADPALVHPGEAEELPPVVLTLGPKSKP